MAEDGVPYFYKYIDEIKATYIPTHNQNCEQACFLCVKNIFVEKLLAFFVIVAFQNIENYS